MVQLLRHWGKFFERMINGALFELVGCEDGLDGVGIDEEISGFNTL